jgi:hypothetical protein
MPRFRSLHLDWSIALTPLLDHPDLRVRSYTGWIVSLANGMSEMQRIDLFRSHGIEPFRRVGEADDAMETDEVTSVGDEWFTCHAILWVKWLRRRS